MLPTFHKDVSVFVFIWQALPRKNQKQQGEGNIKILS